MLRRKAVRAASTALVGVLLSGCASSVYRLDGTYPGPAKVAQNDCEKRDWLVMAPTRYETVSERGVSTGHDDGAGVYAVGSKDPLPIPELEPRMGPDPLFLEHTQPVERANQKRWIAGGLGLAGITAITIGTIVFVNAFGTKQVPSETDPNRLEEEQDVSTGGVALGSILVGVGFGLGIGGLAVNPGTAESTEADTARYAFTPKTDDMKRVRSLVERHNEKVRERCRSGSADPLPE